MDEASARRIVLAQAIETGDAQGRLVSQVEREQIDSQALEAARAVSEGSSPAAIAQLLKARAGLVLQAAGKRDRAIASLQEQGAARWMLAGIPAAALLLGVLTDQVANPHQVNLLSKPLLLLLLWNMAVYAALLAGVLLPARGERRQSRLTALQHWLSGLGEWRRRPGHLRSEVTASFLLRWHALAAPLQGQRLARVLHLAAAAWALGIALSLFAGGIWASYGVQWESTFLSAPDVHRFLRVLFSPVTALFPWASFSLDEVRSLQATGAAVPPLAAADNASGRRWVFLYAMLLALVVVLPRLLLAALAWWRERALARALPLQLDDAYFQRLLAVLSPARVQLCLYAQRGEDRAALLRLLLRRRGDPLRGMGLGQGETHELVSAAGGEVLRLIDLPNIADPAALPKTSDDAPAGWADRWLAIVRGRPEPPPLTPAARALRAAREEADLVLHVVRNAADIAAAAPLLQWLGKPVLVLVNAQDAGLDAPDALAFDRFARSWPQERVLLDAIAQRLPAHKAPGFARLAAAWDERNKVQLREAMAIVARHLLEAARQSEDLGRPPSLLDRLRPGEREAFEQRKTAAMAAIVERIQRSDARTGAGLLALHGAGDGAFTALNQGLQEEFVVREGAIRPGEAGMAGAATGAALGVSIDLVTAGLTLGMAAAAGALVGGGAAWIAAVWKNRTTQAGTAAVQLSDAMLQALVEAALLRYLAVIHHTDAAHAGGAEGIGPGWRSEVVAGVEARSEDLAQQWAAARAPHQVLEPAAALASILESVALAVLERLQPARRPTTAGPA